MGGGALSKRNGRAAASDSGRSSRSALHRSASARLFVSQPARRKTCGRRGTPRHFWSFTSTWHAFQALLQPSALAGGADLQRTHTELAIPGGPLSFLMARAAVQAEANRFSLALMSVKQDLEREGRTCKILEAEVKELRGEPQASTRGLTGVQCGRGEGCNAMSQQNLEEEVGCGQTD